MALKISPGTRELDEFAPLPEAPYATVVTVHDELATVTLREPPGAVPHTGACGCEGCSAASFATLQVEFRPD